MSDKGWKKRSSFPRNQRDGIEGGTPRPARVGGGICTLLEEAARQRRGARLAARPVCAAGGGPVHAAPAGAAGPLAAAGAGSHAQGRQAAPLRMALKQLPCAGGA